jgi:hypothetical protein
MSPSKSGSHRRPGSDREIEKKPYSTPVLKRLGSVRDLTLGTLTNGNADNMNPGNKGSGGH